MIRSATKTTKRRDFNGTQPNGLVLNRKGIRSFKPMALENPNVEFLYLRENELDRFDPYIRLEQLKVLDLSINSIAGPIDFLPLTPFLRHLYLTGNKIDSLSGIQGYQHLETLCLSDNNIMSFDGLEGLPNLRVLSLNFNHIATFRAFPFLPQLHTLNLVGNPVAQLSSYRAMAISLCPKELVSLDGNAVPDEERASVEHYKGKIAFCIGEGFQVEVDNAEEAAEQFLLKMQREMQKAKPLQLTSVRLVSSDASSNILTEGVPVSLQIVMQDIRPFQQRTTEIFFSRYIFPVIFKVSGDATEVFVVGSMNGWTEPIPLERCSAPGDGGEVFFHTTLYLPAGDYEYRYLVDGVEKVGDENKAVSKFKQGNCNIYHVTETQQPVEDQETILYIRWMRSDINSAFTLIEQENGLSYTPSAVDIGTCLRAEVLAYLNGDFSFMYFDISTPIAAGEPTCTKLEIVGNVAEGEQLTVDATYAGGEEGESTLTWYRVLSTGEEVPLNLENPWHGYLLTLDDIGCRIKVEFVPVRNDWRSGKMASDVTAIVAAGVPVCRELKIAGRGEQECELVAETVYSGGTEGQSKYQWFRRDDQSDEFFPIPNETSPKYTATLSDVGKHIAIEYVPVSREGIEGAGIRCVLEKSVDPAPPQLKSLSIRGELEEQHVLIVDHEYYGGYPGTHHIQWFRRDEAKRLTKIGRPNTVSCTLTNKEVDHYIEVVFTPVRSDGAQGKPHSESTKSKVQPGFPQVKQLVINGEPAKGKVLELHYEYFGGEPGEGVIEWSREVPNTHNFDVIAKKTKKYVVQQEDVGRMLKASFTPVRKDGVQGETKVRIIQVPLPTEEEEK